MQLLPTYYLPYREEFVRFNFLKKRYAYSTHTNIVKYTPHMVRTHEEWVIANGAIRITRERSNAITSNVLFT